VPFSAARCGNSVVMVLMMLRSPSAEIAWPCSGTAPQM
jgi:hypothetical protein